MDAGQKRRIEEAVAQMECPSGFERCRLSFERLCEAQEGRRQSCVECLEEKPGGCNFRVPLGSGTFCRCPIRVYVAKELRIMSSSVGESE